MLSLIDADAVAASVSVDQISRNEVKRTSSAAPSSVESAAVPSLDSVASSSPEPEPAKVSSPPPPVAVSKSPPPRSSPASADLQLDLPVPAIAAGFLAAFAAGTFAMRQRGEEDDAAPSSFGAASSKNGDVSIPYDAAARLAYDDWRAANNKGGFAADKYAKFKAKYEEVTCANMAAKKVARDTKSKPKLQTLSASADE